MFIWPAIAVGVSSQATKSRMMRSTMLEVLRQGLHKDGPCQGAKELCSGLPACHEERYVAGGHHHWHSDCIHSGWVRHNGDIFQLPGMGTLLVRAMNQRDYEVVQSMVTIVSVWIVLTNLVVDLTYGWLDPRIRFD